MNNLKPLRQGPILRALPGAVIITAAVVIAVVNRDLSLWDGRRVGPGLVPLATSALLVCSGLAVLVTDLRANTSDEDRSLPIPWRSLPILVGSILFFVLTVRNFGLIPSSFVLVFLSALASPRPRPVEALIVAVTLVLFGCAIFIGGLDLPIPLLTTPW